MVSSGLGIKSLMVSSGLGIKSSRIGEVEGLKSDGLLNHMTVVAESLNKVRAMIYPPANKASKLDEISPVLGETVDKEHTRLLARKSIIEKSKEKHEHQLMEMECGEESRRLQQLKITEEAEQKRLAAEYEQRKNQRILREIEERELEEAQAMLEEAEKRSKKNGGKKPNLEREKKSQNKLDGARSK